VATSNKATISGADRNNQPAARADATINRRQQKKQEQLTATKQCSVIADSDGCWRKLYQPLQTASNSNWRCQSSAAMRATAQSAVTAIRTK